jgi:PST family polysaccharide transporter
VSLVKTSFYVGLASIVRILTAFLVNKVVAIYIGPSGLATIGQLQNFLNISTTLSNGAICTGVTKYTAEITDKHEYKKLFSSTLFLCGVCSFCVSVVCFIFSGYLSDVFFKSSDYSQVFRVFSGTVFLYGLNTILIAILNGKGEIKKYVLVNISGSLFSLILTSFLIYKMSLVGALYALVLNQSLVFFVTLYFLLKSNWFDIRMYLGGPDKAYVKRLLRYSAVSLLGVLSLHVSQFIVRSHLGEVFSWEDAGIWQGMNVLSNMYLMLITTSLSVYYIPKISKISNSQDIYKEVINGFKIVLPTVILFSFLIYISRDLIVYLAFSEEFIPMVDFFKWQLLGDFIKVSSLLLSYVMLARAKIKISIIAELLFAFIFVFTSYIFIDLFLFLGVFYAYIVSYVVYFLFILVFFIKFFVRPKN